MSITEQIGMVKESVPNQQRANELMGRLIDAARPEAIYGAPVTQGEYTVLTASEITVGLGYGYGGGGGVSSSDNEPDGNGGFGSGGGGGGTVAARPVAAIEIGPHGVRVEPVVDPTKITLAFFTAFGAMFMMLAKMRKLAKEAD